MLLEAKLKRSDVKTHLKITCMSMYRKVDEPQIDKAVCVLFNSPLPSSLSHLGKEGRGRKGLHSTPSN